ncbi:MAG: ribosomal L7Ae/L30e/S12e/Gadd45 family protein [Heliobacteriaceae bacterium]|nr:ribosomal L7Ae/L30e/S12e/Gadd45 family protein [Heliobacteriaceae bacterium]MDD4588419.1 ribosomal L7Ae/L30e/S12e/Gadd45 family protein [Heliobacteriaceae bacterium]
MLTKIHALLGLARRAGKLVSGESAVEANLRNGKTKLLILAEDLSPLAAQKYQLWGRDLGIPVLTFGEKASLGLAVGQSPRALVAILDEGFARAINQVFSTNKFCSK